MSNYSLALNRSNSVKVERNVKCLISLPSDRAKNMKHLMKNMSFPTRQSQYFLASHRIRTFPNRERSFGSFFSPFLRRKVSAQFECGFRSKRSEKDIRNSTQSATRRSKSLKLATERNFPQRFSKEAKKINRQ